MMEEGGRIRLHRIPCTRGLDSELRRKRLLAARCYARGSIPRFAILGGQWDGGEIVTSAGGSLLKARQVPPPKPKRKRKKKEASTC